MKKSICLLITFSAILTLSSFAQNTPTTLKDAITFFKFTNDEYKMGKIPYGKSIEYSVIIQNISKDSFMLKSVTPQCGCTTPKYQAGEILYPGSITKVILGFNGLTKGSFSKSININFSNGITKVVKFSGETYSQ